jgi:hypothetical protein
MPDQDHKSSEATPVVKPVPVTPSAGTERPEGLAFDVEEGADLSGVPVGDQVPANPGAGRTQGSQEAGHGVGLAVPEDSPQNVGEHVDGDDTER